MSKRNGLKVLNVLFWNINERDEKELICNVAAATSADVLILLESRIEMTAMLRTLNSIASPDFIIPRAVAGRFQLFSRSRDLDLGECYSGDRVSLRRLNYCGTKLMLGIVHIVDKDNWDPMHQFSEVQLLAAEIRRQELREVHQRTILVGDFNMNPFDQAMNIAAGMNAMMTAQCVGRGSRIQQKRDYPFFYNPMWNLFGDRTPGPAGTVYYSTSSKGHYGWNMLDQVLIRPDAIPWFEGVRILSAVGAHSLETQMGRPSRSDHFPVLLQLK